MNREVPFPETEIMMCESSDKNKISSQELKEIIQEELLLIRHSGEIPEIALHNAIHYLFSDPDGPALQPGDLDLVPLKQAVVDRYRRIILRDLNPDNRDRRIYRGIERSRINWKRLCSFMEREEITGIDPIRKEIAAQLKKFLNQETRDVQSGRRKPSINCTIEELKDFMQELGIRDEELSKGLEQLCPG